jgi:PadR family transcriptional regulator
MADKSSDLVQGTLDMLILKTLALEPMHGYGVAVRIEQISKGVFRVSAGSLFVAFQRLQQAGLIRSEWRATENSRRARYYALTEQGRKTLSSETREWERQVAQSPESWRRRKRVIVTKHSGRIPSAVPKGAGQPGAG